MRRFDQSLFSKVAERLLRLDTEIILSPLNGISSKTDASNRIFHKLSEPQNERRIGAGIWVDAMTAILLRVSLNKEHESAALGYISEHLDNLQPERSVQVAFAALKHVQYSLWAMAHVQEIIAPEILEARKSLEDEKYSDLNRQMDRLARHDPNLWETLKRDFLDQLVPSSLLANRLKSLPMPPKMDESEKFLERHDFSIGRREQELALV